MCRSKHKHSSPALLPFSCSSFLLLILPALLHTRTFTRTDNALLRSCSSSILKLSKHAHRRPQIVSSLALVQPTTTTRTRRLLLTNMHLHNRASHTMRGNSPDCEWQVLHRPHRHHTFPVRAPQARVNAVSGGWGTVRSGNGRLKGVGVTTGGVGHRTARHTTHCTPRGGLSQLKVGGRQGMLYSIPGNGIGMDGGGYRAGRRTIAGPVDDGCATTPLATGRRGVVADATCGELCVLVLGKGVA